MIQFQCINKIVHTRPGHLVDIRHCGKVLKERRFREEGRLLRLDAYLAEQGQVAWIGRLAQNRDRSLNRFLQSFQDGEQGCLPCAIWPDDPMEGPFFNLQ